MNIAQDWRLNGQRYALKGVKCEHCGTALFPPREVCPHCQARHVLTYSFTQPEVIELELTTREELRQAAR